MIFLEITGAVNVLRRITVTCMWQSGRQMQCSFNIALQMQNSLSLVANEG